MKNVLLTTTVLVAFAGAAAADIGWTGSADIGYNDVTNGGMYYDGGLDVVGSFDLGDGYAATISYGISLDNINGVVTSAWDMYPTIEVTSPFGSLKGGDLDDAGASEYFYADRDGMALDVENHDSSARFDVRALVEFGAYGVAVGGVDDGVGGLDGLSVGAGATFGSFTLGLGYDEADAGVAGDSVDETVAVSLDTTFGAASIGISYADSAAETSIGLAVGYDISSDLSVAAYYAQNDTAEDMYGASVAYAMGDLGLDVYYDGGTGATASTYGVDASYVVMTDLTAYAGAMGTDAAGVDAVYYVGATYAINANLSATASYATAHEISGPEYMDGVSLFLSMSF